VIHCRVLQNLNTKRRLSTPNYQRSVCSNRFLCKLVLASSANQQKLGFRLHTNKLACISLQREDACSLPSVQSVSKPTASCMLLEHADPPPNLSAPPISDVNVIPQSGIWPLTASQSVPPVTPGCLSICTSWDVALQTRVLHERGFPFAPRSRSVARISMAPRSTMEPS
jgi:hypothetical protein